MVEAPEAEEADAVCGRLVAAVEQRRRRVASTIRQYLPVCAIEETPIVVPSG